MDKENKASVAVFHTPKISAEAFNSTALFF